MNKTFSAINPSTGEKLSPAFAEASLPEIDKAVSKAEDAFKVYRLKTGKEKALFLERIGDEISALGNELIEVCHQETGLPAARLQNERNRTIGQCKLFATLVREGSWVNARIDTAQPARQPLPKPDIRQIQIPLGPVGVFGASNFPLAFSVAGGDTISALAAGCTVVVKAHPAHPATSALVATAIDRAAQATGMPEGVFALIQGATVETGMTIVNHPLIKAIGFTGSTKGGRAIAAAAAARPEPIPVFAEMGSTNPMFILPGALREKATALANGLAASVTLGVGQFCTNPGMVMMLQSAEAEFFLQQVKKQIETTPAGIMLTERIKGAFDAGIEKALDVDGVSLAAQGQSTENRFSGSAKLLQTTADIVLANTELTEEIFGPGSLAIVADNKSKLLRIAENMHGHLTATIHATPIDLAEYHELVAILERKVGRLLFNGFPTGVEVTHAMVHGGPFPATSDGRSTSVGMGAIYRFTRPICYQDFPATCLPEALQDHNPANIWRLVNGDFTKEKITFS